MVTEPRSESQLQDRVRRAVKERWPSAWSFHPVGGPWQEPGIPDLLWCIEGQFIAMELKLRRPGESLNHAILRATPGQQAQIRRINAAGGVAAVITSVEEALDLVERALARSRDASLMAGGEEQEKE